MPDVEVPGSEAFVLRPSQAFMQYNLASPPKPLPCFSPAAGSTAYNNPLPPALLFSCLPIIVDARAGLALIAYGQDSIGTGNYGDGTSATQPITHQTSLANARVAFFSRSSDSLQGPIWGGNPRPPYWYAGGFADNAWLTASTVWLEEYVEIRSAAHLWMREQLVLELGPCTQSSAQALAAMVPGITFAAGESVDLRGQPGGLVSETAAIAFECGGVSSFELGDLGAGLEMVFFEGVVASERVNATAGTVVLPRVTTVPAPSQGYPGSMVFDEDYLYLKDDAGDWQAFGLA